MPPEPPHRVRSRVRAPTVSVVIPVLDEEANLPYVLEGLPPVDEVIVVDGGSTDDTVAVAREIRPDAVVLRQTRSGKGNALVCGFAACTADIVITLDGDGSADPGEIPRYVDALLAGAEVAHGSRYREGGGNLDARRWDGIRNRGYHGFVNTLFGTRFTDVGFGYNAFWRALLPVLDLPDAYLRLPRGTGVFGDGPEIQPLINIRMAAQGLRVVEVASIGYPPIHGTREHRPVHQSALAIRTALSEYLRRWQLGRQARPGAHAPATRVPRRSHPGSVIAGGPSHRPGRPVDDAVPTGYRDRARTRSAGVRRPELAVISGEGARLTGEHPPTSQNGAIGEARPTVRLPAARSRARSRALPGERNHRS